mgnify:FL=1
MISKVYSATWSLFNSDIFGKMGAQKTYCECSRENCAYSESVKLDEVPNLIVCVLVEMIIALENDMSKKSRIQIFAM